MVQFLIFAFLLFFAVTNSWRFNEDIRVFFNEFRSFKKKGLEFSLCGAGIKRRRQPTIWNGLGQIASDDSGLYYASVCTPFTFVPWSKVSFIASKGLKETSYSLLKVAGYPEIIILLPKRLNLEKRKLSET